MPWRCRSVLEPCPPPWYLQRIKGRRAKVKGLVDLMKQAQKIKAKMEELQEEMAQRTVEASAGGGMVKVVMNGRQEILRLEIDPEVVDPQEVEMLEDLIIAAVNEGIRRSQQLWSEELQKLTGGLPIPGIL